jgi:hypothetical protein
LELAPGSTGTLLFSQCNMVWRSFLWAQGSSFQCFVFFVCLFVGVYLTSVAAAGKYSVLSTEGLPSTFGFTVRAGAALGWQSTCFFSVLWHGEAFHLLGVQNAEDSALPGVLPQPTCLLCLSKIPDLRSSHSLNMCPSHHFVSSC